MRTTHLIHFFRIFFIKFIDFNEISKCITCEKKWVRVQKTQEDATNCKNSHNHKNQFDHNRENFKKLTYKTNTKKNKFINKKSSLSIVEIKLFQIFHIFFTKNQKTVLFYAFFSICSKTFQLFNVDNAFFLEAFFFFDNFQFFSIFFWNWIDNNTTLTLILLVQINCDA